MPKATTALLLFVLLCGTATAATPEHIKEIAREMVCLCGNCNRESLATCICSDFAVPERQNIGRALDEGQTKEQIIASYLDNFGEMILASPPVSGFNIVAWVTPFALLLGGVVLVRIVLVNWRRRSDQPRTEPPPSSAPSSDSRQRLQRELDRLDEDD